MRPLLRATTFVIDSGLLALIVFCVMIVAVIGIVAWAVRRDEKGWKP